MIKDFADFLESLNREGVAYVVIGGNLPDVFQEETAGEIYEPRKFRKQALRKFAS